MMSEEFSQIWSCCVRGGGRVGGNWQREAVALNRVQSRGGSQYLSIPPIHKNLCHIVSLTRIYNKLSKTM